MQTAVVLAALLGLGCGAWPVPGQQAVANTVVTVYLNVLRLVSLPIIFLALCTTIAGMETVSALAQLGRRVVFYTLSTTVVAAAVALGLFLWVAPVRHVEAPQVQATQDAVSYSEHLMGLIPSHFFQPFMEGNVMGVLLMAVALGLALLTVRERASVHAVGSGLLAALLKIIQTVTRGVPLLVWAGMVLSFDDLRQGASLRELGLYLLCVVGANLIQGLGVLPLLLKSHGIAPWAAARGFLPALSLAFFSKSSVATIPVAIRCAEESLGVQPRVARFTFPICTTINMNACAAFILITVLFVSTSYGRVYAPWELLLWVGVATLAAVGNAGVPMGCYTLTCALLAAMNVPVTKMTLILPVYSLLDMLETAINVWSDGCVALLVNRRTRAEAQSADDSLQAAA